MVRPTRLRRTTLQKVTEAVPYGVGRQIGGMIAATGERSRFRAMVAEADRARDRGDWAEAERGYRAALAIVPDSAGYRVQLGHMLKEQGRKTEIGPYVLRARERAKDDDLKKKIDDLEA